MAFENINSLQIVAYSSFLFSFLLFIRFFFLFFFNDFPPLMRSQRNGERMDTSENQRNK